MIKKYQNILVTGGAGYIGSHITHKLNRKIIVIDNLSSGSKKMLNKKAIFINEDIRNTSKISKIIKKFNIDSIIHLAAHISVEESVKNPNKYYNNNIEGTLSILKACKNSKLKNLIFSSTAAVYGESESKKKYSEEDIKMPNNPYGISKLVCEEIIKSFCKNNINYAILRYFNVVGSDYKNKIGQIRSSDHLFKNCSRNIINNKNIKIYGKNYLTKDGTAIRDYIHINDLIDLHILALNYISNNKSLIINCGYGKGHSVKEVAEEFLKYNESIKIKYCKKRMGDPTQIVADNSKILKIFKWKPKFNNLSIMVKDTILWEKYISDKKNL